MPSGPERKTSFRLWNSMTSFRSWTPFAFSLATSASRSSTAKQRWLNPSLVRSPMAGSGEDPGGGISVTAPPFAARRWQDERDVFGLDAFHAHIGRELWARDHDGLVFLEPSRPKNCWRPRHLLPQW